MRRSLGEFQSPQKPLLDNLEAAVAQYVVYYLHHGVDLTFRTVEKRIRLHLFQYFQDQINSVVKLR